MINKCYEKIRASVYAILLCLSPPTFAFPVLNIDNRNLLHDAKAQHDYYFKQYSTASYLYSFSDSSSYRTAEQYQKLLDAGVIVEEPEYKVDEIFVSAFKELKISSSDHFDFLITAFTSPIYKTSPSLQLLISLYRSVFYGSSVQANMQSVSNWDFGSGYTLWFLANFPLYRVFKPHLKQFLNSTYVNSATPTLYNVDSHVINAALSSENEDYWEDLGKEIGFFILKQLSCKPAGKELRNEISFMESCKLSKNSVYRDLKDLKHNESYVLDSVTTSGPSKIRLTPVPGYFIDFSRQHATPEEYSRKSLHHVMNKVIEDKTEGALFFILYRGADKYQFFTLGVYQGFLTLSYIVDDHPPTPFLSFLIPMDGMKLDALIDGIHYQLHQSKSDHDMVPDLQGVWMMSSH